MCSFRDLDIVIAMLLTGGGWIEPAGREEELDHHGLFFQSFCS